MAESELTTQILKDIRTEIRGLREDQRTLAEQQRGFAENQQRFGEQAMQRFEIVETTLRDLAEQLVILGRGVKVAIEARRATAE